MQKYIKMVPSLKVCWQSGGGGGRCHLEGEFMQVAYLCSWFPLCTILSVLIKEPVLLIDWSITMSDAI